MHATRSRQGRLTGILGMLALLGAGCGGGGHSGGIYADLQWSLADLGDPTTGITCEDVGAGDIVVTLQETTTQASYSDTLPCNSQNYSASYTVPRGTYSITATLYGDPLVFGNATTVLDTIQLTQTVVNGPNTVPLDFLVNSYILNWSISSGGFVTTCASVGASHVELDIYYPGQSTPDTYLFDCNSNFNPVTYVCREITTAIAAGSYNIQWQAYLQDAYYNDLASTQSAGYGVVSGVQAELGTAYFAF
jgi:hypothetical protein